MAEPKKRKPRARKSGSIGDSVPDSTTGGGLSAPGSSVDAPSAHTVSGSGTSAQGDGSSAPPTAAPDDSTRPDPRSRAIVDDLDQTLFNRRNEEFGEVF